VLLNLYFNGMKSAEQAQAAAKGAAAHAEAG
jgi:hypothetical protein